MTTTSANNLDTKAALPDIEWALANTLGKLHNVTIVRTADSIKLGGAVEVLILALERGFLIASSEYKKEYPLDDLSALLLDAYTLYTQLVFMHTMASLKEKHD